MSKIKIGIVEDEMITAEDIATTLIDLGYDVCEPCPSYGEAIEMLDDEHPDMVLIDIQLAGKKDGIDLAWKIRENYDIPFIFLTSNTDKATLDRAKQVNPPAYLVKPFKDSDLFTAIEMAMFNYNRKIALSQHNSGILAEDALFIKKENLYCKILFKDIEYLKSDQNYAMIYTVDGDHYMFRGKLEQVADTLRDKISLYRTHRRYYVNIDLVKTVMPNCIIMGKTKTEVPLARAHRKDFLDHVNMINP